MMHRVRDAASIVDVSILSDQRKLLFEVYPLRL